MKCLVIALLSGPRLLGYQLGPEQMQCALGQVLHLLLGTICQGCFSRSPMRTRVQYDSNNHHDAHTANSDAP